MQIQLNEQILNSPELPITAIFFGKYEIDR